jgi:Tfp pilus assembly protein PilN
VFALVALLALSTSFASPEGVRLWLIAWFAHLTCLALFAWGGFAKGFGSKCSPGGVRLVVIAGSARLQCSPGVVRLGMFAWACSHTRIRQRGVFLGVFA